MREKRRHFVRLELRTGEYRERKFPFQGDLGTSQIQIIGECEKGVAAGGRWKKVDGAVEFEYRLVIPPMTNNESLVDVRYNYRS